MIRASTLAVTGWRKSSYSTNGGDCVETGEGVASVVPVRDSKTPHGPALVFGPAAWSSFVSALRHDEFVSR